MADWVPASTTCASWGVATSPTGDDQCLAGAATTGEPAALLRGGSFLTGTAAGPFAISATDQLTLAGSSDRTGFRCAR